MKIAKVVSVRDRGPLTGKAGAGGEAHPGPADVAASLRDYPHIGEAERRRLLHFLRRASRTQVRDTFLRQGLEPRLIAFRKDHKRQLGRGWTRWAPVILGVLLIAELIQLLL